MGGIFVSPQISMESTREVLSRSPIYRVFSYAAEEETYHTQEGYRLVLQEAMAKNVPLELISKLEDPESKFNNFKPHDLLAPSNADLDTVLGAKEPKELRDTPSSSTETRT